MKCIVTRKYYKVIEVEADSIEEVERKINEDHLFDDTSINGFEDEIVAIDGRDCSINLE